MSDDLVSNQMKSTLRPFLQNNPVPTEMQTASLQEKPRELDGAKGATATPIDVTRGRIPAAIQEARRQYNKKEKCHLEKTVLRELEEKKTSIPSPSQKLLLVSDPNKDPDDVVVYVMASWLAKHGFIDIGAVVTTLGDEEVRSKRAQFAKSVFAELGQPEVPVLVGKDYPMVDDKQRKEHAKFLPLGYLGESFLADATQVRKDSRAALIEQLKAAADKSVTLLVIAGMTDVQDVLDACPDLVKQKIKEVVVMGGVKRKKDSHKFNETTKDREPNPAFRKDFSQDPEGFVKDSESFVKRDKRAYNNLTDATAAKIFYRGVQAAGIPLKILSKEAAYRAAVSPSFYEDIGDTGHVVGQYLRDVQKSALEGLWNGILNGELPKHLNLRWFFDTFTSKKPGDEELERLESQPPSFDEMWNGGEITKLNLYDPLALLAAVDASCAMLFKPTRISEPGNSPVNMIGAEEVIDQEKAITLMSAMSTSALLSPRSAG